MRSRLRSTGLLTAALCVAGLSAAGCGGEDHPNEPRPPKPVEVTAKVDTEKVAVSPSEFGAGLVVFTISNQSDSDVRLTLDGPTEAASDPVPPGSVSDSFKVAMQEGEYEVTAGADSDARAADLRVGPERASSQDELLLP